MRITRFLLFTAFTLLGTIGFGQTMRIEGTVYDTTGVNPLPNTVAMAVRMKDSLMLGYARTDKDGKFVLTGFEVDTFSLILDHPDFDDKIYYMFGSADNYDIKIPSIIMPSKAQKLDEVVIYAFKDPIYYKGDTLVYVADSFKVHENAVVEDLLKKLPGLEVDENGKIKSQGQDISKVLVDGDEFFGSDPTIATKNLGAKGVESVQVYETENENRGDGEDEKIKVLDLKLKDAYKSGYFGRITGASDFALTPNSDGEIGTNPFYEGEFLFNRFNGAQKFSIFALGTNTPRSNFGWNDIRQFGLDNETASGQWWDRNASGNTSGIPQTFRAGIYFSDKLGKKNKVKLGFNYSYYNEKIDAISDSRSQYFLTDTTYFTEDYKRNYSVNESHRINFNISAPLDSFTTIEFKPSVSIDNAKVIKEDRTAYFSSDDIGSLVTSVDDTTESSGYTVSARTRLERKFRKKGRELELLYDFDLDDNKSDENLLTSTEYLIPFQDTFMVDQRKNNYNSSITHYGSVTYTEPLAKYWELETEYSYEYGFSTQDKSTFDRNGNVYTDFNDSLSNIFDNTRQQHLGGVKLKYEPKKHTFAVALRVRNINIDNFNKVTDSLINQNISNFLPVVEYHFKPSVSKRLRITYRTNSQQPSINDLAPVPNNSNPNSIREGNPDLKPNYTHNFNVMFNTWQALSGRYVWIGGNAMITDNAFATSTTYDQFGLSRSKTVNVDGNVFASLFGGAGVPLYKRIIELRPNINANYNRYSNFINDEKNVTTSLTAGGGLGLNFKWDSLQIELSNTFAYNNPQSSLNSSSNTPYTTQSYRIDIDWRLPFGFIIGTDAKYTINSQPGEGFYDYSYLVWNAELGKTFLKTENLVVSVVGNDILNQNINAARQVNGNVITDNRTTIISRYFLLKATLRFNNNKTKQNDLEHMF